jgi:uncharacterized protein YbcI
MSEITGQVLALVSNEMVRLKAEHYGKGPTEAKAYLNDDFLFVVLKGGLTRVEETLVRTGDAGLVRTMRLRFQEQMRAEFEGAVERLTGRRVLTFASQILFDPDYVVEIFRLQSPAEGDGAGDEEG